METPAIGRIPVNPPVRRVHKDRRGGSGGTFERTFEDETRHSEDSTNPEATTERPSPPGLQVNKPAIRREQDAGDHQVDIVV